MMRSVLERLTQSLRFRRRLPAEFSRAPVWVSPSAGLRFLFRRLADADSALLAFAREFVRPGAVVWDVGANVGLFSFASAARAGRNGLVVAIEPDTVLVQLLRRSAAIQPVTSAPVRVVPAAAAGAPGIRTFCVASRARQTSFLDGYGTTQVRGPVEMQSVLAMTADWLQEQVPPPDVLKIDVEGAELEVLRGARTVLERKRPVILCEVGAATSAEISALLVSHGYRMVDGNVAPSQRDTLTVASWCTLALPT